MKHLILFCCVFLAGWSLFAQPNPYRLTFRYAHTKISADSGKLGLPLSAGHRLGQAMAVLPDSDGDGHQEVWLAAGKGATREFWRLHPDSSGEIQARYGFRPGEAGWPEVGATDDFGYALAPAGDWDGDGVTDLLVGAPEITRPGLAYGGLWLLQLEAGGQVKTATCWNERTPALNRKLGREQRFGAAACRLGDLDGDGRPELAVGAPGHPEKHLGLVWILFSDAQGGIRQALPLGKGDDELSEQLRRGDRFGQALAAPGDLDGDGIPDLIVGAPGDGSFGYETGAVYVLFLRADGRVRQFRKLYATAEGFGERLDTKDHWGSALAWLGPLDADSLPELAVGAPGHDDGGFDKGAVYLLSLHHDGRVGAFDKISQLTENYAGKVGYEYRWGEVLAPLGDLDQDGYPDLAVGGPEENDGARAAGGAWWLFPRLDPDRYDPLRSWAEEAFRLTAADSARAYAGARDRADSTRIEARYDLSGFAPNNLVFLLDVSGSMREPEKLPLLRDAFLELLRYMRPSDKVTLITYSGKPEVVLDGVPVLEKDRIRAAILTLDSSGETKPAKALRLAYARGRTHWIEGGNNRIFFASDWEFDTGVLNKVLAREAGSDLPLSVFYFGEPKPEALAGMQTLARHGMGEVSHITEATVRQALLRETRYLRLWREEQEEKR